MIQTIGINKTRHKPKRLGNCPPNSKAHAPRGGGVPIAPTLRIATMRSFHTTPKRLGNCPPNSKAHAPRSGACQSLQPFV
jgi:hypothetical protein